MQIVFFAYEKSFYKPQARIMKQIQLRAQTIFRIVLFSLAIWIPRQSTAQLINAASYDHVIRVACVGNSITWGFGIENRDSLSYPAQLGRLLGEKWEVRNFGVSSRTLLSKGDRPYINEQAYADAKAFLPDVVLIKLGTNDTKPRNWEFIADLETDYRSLIQSFQQLDSKPLVILLKAVPAFPERWGISDSLINGELNPRIEKLAKELGLPCIDLHAPMVGRGNLFPDLIHPNAEGAGIMARILFNELTGSE